MKKTLLCRMLLLVLASCLGSPAAAQNAAIVSGADGSITIDASRLNAIIPLDAPWRFHAGEDPRFADPSFDDSSWPLIRPGRNRLLADAHVPNIPDGRSWARLHVHIVNASGPLAIIVTAREATRYAVFANGKQIGATKGFATGTPYFNQPFILLPQTRDVVLAVHFVLPGGGLAHYFPLEHFEVGQSEAVGDRIDLGRYRDFEELSLTEVVTGMIFLAFVPISLALLLAQRSHREYLWLAVFCLFVGMACLEFPVMFAGWISASQWVRTLGDLIGSGVSIASLEFVAALADFRPRRVIRIVQASYLVSPVLFGLSAYRAVVAYDAVGTVFSVILIVYILFPAYRRGRKECGLLLIPLSIYSIAGIVSDAQYFSPNLFGPQRPPGHLGGVGVTLDNVGALLFIAGLMAVMLYRFIRVSKDEKIAAAELEAARTVQQLLIPATSPATPGFIVESVYLPAQQVGGDFFLVLPAPEGSDDHSLLAVMGDVSGKGLQAAMVVSTIIGGLRMQLSRQPAEVLAHLNRMLTGHVSGFATCCAALIQSDGRMTIANAGNPAPYCDGEEIPTLAGLPLGLVSEVVYEETGYTVPVGSHLTFVSDGVVEATSFPAKELFGFDRTKAISGQSASTIAEAASNFGVGAPQADDITVLTVARA
jgi:hypothetical protein